MTLDLRIFVMTHRETYIPQLDGYIPMMVGAARCNDVLPVYARDDIGENISHKNSSYSELTGLYWIWKNDGHDYVGLVHYRRFFVKNIKSLFTFRGRYVVLDKDNAYSVLTMEDCEDLLSECDVLVKRSKWRWKNNGNILRCTVGNEVWDLTKKVFEKMHPDEMETFRVVEKMHTHFNCNMFIGKKTVMDRYCGWLFPILQMIDKIHEGSAGEYYHNREIGYIPEFLFRVWLIDNNIKYRVIPVINTESIEDLDGVMELREFIPFVIDKALEKIRWK